jgi:hypothetical protein
LPARHIRGLDEKICSVFAPTSDARAIAFETPPAVPKWIPIRFTARFAMLRVYRPASASNREWKRKRRLDAATSGCNNFVYRWQSIEGKIERPPTGISQHSSFSPPGNGASTPWCRWHAALSCRLACILNIHWVE